MNLENYTDGFVLIDCMDCRKIFPVPEFRGGEFEELLRRTYETERICPACLEKREAAEIRAERERRNAARLKSLPELVRRAGIPDGYSHDRATGELFREPPVRFAAEWVWLHRESHLLLSGVTGSGKSTSACFVAARMIGEGKAIRYISLRELLAEWREAKTCDRALATEKMLREIFRNDLYIIDEVMGKVNVSMAGIEFLFELLEAVNNGRCGCRIWLMGNFYEGSIEEMFSDPEPVRRRLHYNFLCVHIDRETKKITPLKVWEEKP